jgi:hypothetical protein
LPAPLGDQPAPVRRALTSIRRAAAGGAINTATERLVDATRVGAMPQQQPEVLGIRRPLVHPSRRRTAALSDGAARGRGRGTLPPDRLAIAVSVVILLGLGLPGILLGLARSWVAGRIRVVFVDRAACASAIAVCTAASCVSLALAKP